MQRNLALNELILSLSQEANTITDWLGSSGHAVPSSTVTWPEQMPSDVRAARQRLASVAKILSRVALGPDDYLHDLAWSPLTTSALRWIIRHGIPEAVDLDKGTSYEEIARTCNVDLAEVQRIVRFATYDSIFHEPTPGQVAHTAFSAALVTDRGLRALVTLNMEDTAPASTKLIEAQKKWPGSQEPSHSPWNYANNTDLHVFRSQPIRSDDIDWSKIFINMMEYDNRQPFYSLHHVVEAFDWQSIDHVVDIGGGSGDVAMALVTTHSHLKVYVADREQAVAAGQKRIAPSIASQVEFVACDFFAPLPAVIAEKKTFMLRRILHNWSDMFASKIITNLLPALQNGATLLVMDMVLPEPGAVPEDLDRTVRGLDLVMKHILNGKERSQEEWQKLFAAVDKNLVVDSITRPEGSGLSLLQVEYDSAGAH